MRWSVRLAMTVGGMFLLLFLLHINPMPRSCPVGICLGNNLDTAS